MGRLYEVNQKILTALEKLDGDENGEIADFEGTCKELETLEIEKKEILQWICKEYLNTKSGIEELKAEIERLEERKKKVENRADSLLYVLVRETDGQKTDMGVATIYPRENTSVKLNDDALPFLKEKYPHLVKAVVTETADKKALKELLKSGVELTGCWLQQTMSYSVR